MIQVPGRSKSFNVRMIYPPEPESEPKQLLVVTRRSDPRQPSAKLRLIAIGLATLLVPTIFVVAFSRTHLKSPAVNRLGMPSAMRHAAQQQKEVDLRSEQAQEEVLLKAVQLEMEIQAQLQTQIEQLVQARSVSDFNHQIQGISERAVFSKFGQGPYRVQVIMGNSESFVLEMISVKDMPHTLHHFLDMVDYGLWDGATLVHGMGAQSFLAIPRNSRGEYAQQEFDNVQLGSLPFEQESVGYPHEKYTVSFSKQRGPDFYMNLQDDAKHNEFASCFAKVVEGFDVLEKIVGGGDNLDNMRFFNIEQMRVAF